MKKLKILKFVICIVVVFCVSLLFGNNKFNDTKKFIDKTLETKSYSYLPKEAKNYIRDVYEKTGQLLLTEKNKEDNTPYLNPAYIDYITMSEETQSEENIIPFPTIIDYTDSQTIDDANDIPSKYNLNSVNGKNFVTPVRNQGNLGICWAFASSGSVESSILKTSNSPYSADSTLISERQIDYATSQNGIVDYETEYNIYYDRALGDGGNFYIAALAMLNGVSAFNYNNFKEYNDNDLSKMELRDVINYKNSEYELDETIDMPYLNYKGMEKTDALEETKENFVNEVKSHIMEYGAAYVSTYYNNRCVYNESDLDNEVIDVDSDCIKSGGGHAMQIIGWDDTAEYSYCADTTTHKDSTNNCSNIVTGRGVWILKNSWGEDTPNPYLTYDSLKSEIHFIKKLNDKSVKNWDNNYIIKTQSSIVSITGQTEFKLSDSNVKDTEKLSKVKLYTENYDSTYSIKIKYSDGTYSDSYSVHSDEPGLATIDLSGENIELTKDCSILLTSNDGYYHNTLFVFTSNSTDDEYIDLAKYKDTDIIQKSIRMYSETKGIASGEQITYKIYDANNNDLSNNITVSNNYVAENNINTIIAFNSLDSGKYKLAAYHNNELIEQIDITYIGMEGKGTSSNPYIITNASQLDQIRNDLDAYYELGSDIDLTSATRENDGILCNAASFNLGCHGWNSINNFSGHLDGKGHVIKGLYQRGYLKDNSYYSQKYTDGGLFLNIKKDAVIKNIILQNFDIECSKSCGALAASYDNESDNSVYNVEFSKVAVKNSKIKAIKVSNSTAKASGLIGKVYSLNSNFTFKNIYIDSDIEASSTFAGISAEILANSVELNNIQILSNLKSKYNDGSDCSGIINYIQANNIKINNLLSTLKNNVKRYFIGSKSYVDSDINISNVNMLKNDNASYFGSSDISANLSNVNTYELGVDSNKLRKSSSYSNWDDFNNNWEIKKIDDIERIPVLKNANFEYTSMSDIDILIDEDNRNIYDYITPNTSAAKRIIYTIADTSVATIDEDGNITPLKIGTTKIHVESLYDGFEKDILINVHAPSYSVRFDANTGQGIMPDLYVEIGKSINLLKNSFIKEGYKFIGWNTKSDGTGESYIDEELVSLNLNENEQIVLYAQWKIDPKVYYKTHVQTYGWQDYVSNGQMSGTSGEAKRLEGIKIKLDNIPYSGGVEYRTHVQSYGWQNFVKDDQMSGTSGEAKRLEAIEIKLTGEIADYYDIYYRVHAQTYGWLDWAKNGQSAGTAELSKRLEAIEIVLVEKNGEAPGKTSKPFIKPLIYYQTHVQTYGWQNYVYDGLMSGTSGEYKRLEAIKIRLNNLPYVGSVQYRTHVQTYGWQDYVINNQLSGTSGEAKRLEAIEIKLIGEIADYYDIYYRVHAQTYGWLDWAKNGQSAGTAALAKRLEGIEIVLIEKGESPPGSTTRPFVQG